MSFLPIELLRMDAMRDRLGGPVADVPAPATIRVDLDRCEPPEFRQYRSLNILPALPSPLTWGSDTGATGTRRRAEESSGEVALQPDVLFQMRAWTPGGDPAVDAVPRHLVWYRSSLVDNRDGDLDPVYDAFWSETPTEFTVITYWRYDVAVESDIFIGFGQDGQFYQISLSDEIVSVLALPELGIVEVDEFIDIAADGDFLFVSDGCVACDSGRIQRYNFATGLVDRELLIDDGEGDKSAWVIDVDHRRQRLYAASRGLVQSHNLELDPNPIASIDFTRDPYTGVQTTPHWGQPMGGDSGILDRAFCVEDDIIVYQNQTDSVFQEATELSTAHSLWAWQVNTDCVSLVGAFNTEPEGSRDLDRSKVPFADHPHVHYERMPVYASLSLEPNVFSKESLYIGSAAPRPHRSDYHLGVGVWSLGTTPTFVPLLINLPSETGPPPGLLRPLPPERQFAFLATIYLPGEVQSPAGPVSVPADTWLELRARGNRVGEEVSYYWSIRAGVESSSPELRVPGWTGRFPGTIPSRTTFFRAADRGSFTVAVVIFNDRGQVGRDSVTIEVDPPVFP